MDNSIENILQDTGIRPTANRILVARTMLQSDKPLSLIEIEDELLSIDKSVIFRTLKLFGEHHLVQIHVALVSGVRSGKVASHAHHTSLGEGNGAKKIHYLRKMVIKEHLRKGQENAILLLLLGGLGFILLLHHAILAQNVVETVPTVVGITVVDIVHAAAVDIGADGLGKFAEIVVPGVHSPIGIEGVTITGHEGTGHELVASDHGRLRGVVVSAVEIVDLAGNKAGQNDNTQNQ